MNFPIFASFIVFVVWLTYELKKSERGKLGKEESFWKREAEANNTRRKSLEDLDYIAVPLDGLPILPDTTDEKLLEYQDQITALSKKEIVNFTGITNTDLKLQYGAPNIPELTRFDQNFTVLARTLYLWGKRLHELNRTQEARAVLEFGIRCRTDISSHYILLAKIYREQGQPEKIRELIETAESLDVIIKNSIVRRLNELYDARPSKS